MITRRQLGLGALAIIGAEAAIAIPILTEGTPAMAATSPNIGFRYFGFNVTPVTGTFSPSDFDNQMGYPITVPLTGGKTATGRIIGVNVAADGTSATIYIKAAALSVVGIPPAAVTEFPTDPTVGT